VKTSVNTANVQMGIAALNVADTDKGENRWYTHNKWKDLPENKQAAIQKARAARKTKGKEGKGPDPRVRPKLESLGISSSKSWNKRCKTRSVSFLCCRLRTLPPSLILRNP